MDLEGFLRGIVDFTATLDPRMALLFFVICCLGEIGISILFQDNKNPLVEVGLSIASVTYGGMMGIFLMGRSFKVFNERAAIAGVVISIAFNLLIVFATDIFWLWYVCIGFAVSFGIGVSINLVIKD